jgi:hypothetical protein
MVHDYAARLLRPPAKPMPAHPMRFAEAYYAHYPKVAIGHWPPLFYAIQAGWMVPAGRSRPALLALMAIFSAALAASIFHAARPAAGEASAFCAAMMFLLVPVVQRSIYSVTPEIPIALVVFWTGIAYARYLETHGAGLFVFCASAGAALLLHGRGLVIVLVIVWMSVLTRRVGVFKRRTFWFAAFALAVITTPWFLMTPQVRPFSLDHLVENLRQFPVALVRQCGWTVIIFALIGIASIRYRDQPRFAAMPAIAVSVGLLHSAANVAWNDRYIVTGLPPLAILMAIGWRRIAPAPEWRTVLALATLLLARGALESKPSLGYPALVESLLAGPDAARRVYLTAGDALHEGGFISELLLREQPGRHVVVRASKALSTTKWSYDYQLIHHSAAEVAEYLRASHIGAVVMQDTRRPAHMDFLMSALENNPAWQPVQAPRGIRIYRRLEPEPPGPLRLRIRMRGALNRDIELIE